MNPKAVVSEKNSKEVKEIKSLIKQHSIIGIIDLTSLPSAQLQALRHKVKKDVLIKTAKKRLIKIAINDAKEEIKNITELLPSLEKTMPALIVTSMNPFKLASLLNKNKSNVPAKPGQISPKDIVLQAGPTNFTPGPIIGELAAVGIKTMIQEGKIAIKESLTFVHKGEIIEKKKADILAKMGIEPMEIGMNLVAVYEKGFVYLSDILGISEETYINMIKESYQNSFNLAVFIDYMSKETVPFLIRKAYSESKALASKTNIEFNEELKRSDSKESSHEKPHHEHHGKHEISRMDEIDKGVVGYTEEAVEKAQNILKELQDQKISEKRT